MPLPAATWLPGEAALQVFGFSPKAVVYMNLSEGDIVRMGTTEMVFKSLWLPPGGPQP